MLVANVVLKNLQHGGWIMWPVVATFFLALCVLLERSYWWISLRRSIRPDAQEQAREALGTGNFAAAWQLGQQMQGRLSEIQSQLAQQTVTVSAGGGMVQATADGRGQIRAIKIDPQAVAQGDLEMLEDLVLAAVAEAQKRASELYQAEVRKLASGLPFPLPSL